MVDESIFRFKLIMMSTTGLALVTAGSFQIPEKITTKNLNIQISS